MFRRPALEVLERRTFLNSAVPEGPEFRVNEYTFKHQQQPRVAMDDAGNVAVVYQDSGDPTLGLNGRDGSLAGVYAGRFLPSGEPASGDFRINAFTTGNQRHYDVDMAPDGDFVVAWTDEERHHVYAQRYSPGATGAPILVAGGFSDPPFPSHPTVMMEPSGAFTIFYHRDVGRFRRFAADGTPLGPDAPLQLPQFFSAQAITGTADGGFVAAWMGHSPVWPQRRIMVQRFSADGAPIGTPLETGASSFAHPIRITASHAGEHVVTWVEDFLGEASLKARRFAADGTPATPALRVSPNYINPKRDHAAAFTADGGFVVTWQDDGIFPSENPNVMARVFDASSRPLGAPFVVNTHTTGFQGEPRVAADGAGDFVVTWSSGAAPVPQDGSGGSVHAQRYARGTLEDPVVLDIRHEWRLASYVHVGFSVDVSASLSLDDLVVRHLTSGTELPASNMLLTNEPHSGMARLKFPGYSDGVPPNGRYELVVRGAGITNANGTPVAGDTTFPFWVLAGDANRNGTVDLNDFGILAGSFGTSGTVGYLRADFNFDGFVNLDDFQVLAANFGQSVPTAPAAAAPERGAAGSGLFGDQAERDDDSAPPLDELA